MNVRDDQKAYGAKHSALIIGLPKIYEVLSRMQHMERDRVRRPPYNVTEKDIPTSYLSDLGFSGEAITVIQELPFPAQGYPRRNIIPGSCTLSYLSDGDLDDNVRFLIKADGEYDHLNGLLPPSAFKLSEGNAIPHDKTREYIYDCADQTITEYSPFKHSGTRFADLPHKPAADVLDEWLENYRSLVWVPFNGFLASQQPEFDERFDITPEALLGVDEEKREQLTARYEEVTTKRNEFFAFRNVFVRARWPMGFKLDNFRRLRKEFTEERAWRVVPENYPTVPEEDRVEHALERERQWLKQWAEADVVFGPGR